MASSKGKKTTRKASSRVECEYCGQEFSAQGMGAHQRSFACKEARAAANQDDGSEADAYADLLAAHRHNNVFASGTAADASQSAGPSQPQPRITTRTRRDPVYQYTVPEFEYDDPQPAGPIPTSPSPTSNHSHNDSDPQPDDIKIEYHPKSKQADRIFHFEEYSPGPSPPETTSIPINKEPWKPFRTRLDFEMAEYIQDMHLNAPESDRLLKLVRQCIANPESFTIKNSDDLKKGWKHASEIKATGFVKKTINVPYQDDTIPFEVSYRSVWEYCVDILKNPTLCREFIWNAEKRYKFNAKTRKWERFFNEPCAGDSWWKVQLDLPDGASPLMLIFYADKTRLSSFGTEKGYPVMVRIANLPMHLRNGEGIAGGRVVGFLPIVPEDAGQAGKRQYVNFKRVVWHKAFYELIKEMETYAQTGYTMECGDKVTRWIFPIILILSADYEEQCIMALIRGTNSDFPCPVCLVPDNMLYVMDPDENFDPRSNETMQEALSAAKVKNAKDKEEYLKGFGLREAENVFWKMKYSPDVYQALSWDRLHAYHGGLFSDHLWQEFKNVVDKIGKDIKREVAVKIDTQVDAIPRWSGLYHFKGIMKAGEYTDGSKYEDMSKIIIFASYNVLRPDVSERGFLLLQLIRSYLELDMFMSLTVHTETTITYGKEELLVFEGLLEKYMAVHPAKSWNFPKAHSHRHTFDDIQGKGVTPNYNTKPFEKAHRSLKAIYQQRTNFKNVIPQITSINEAKVAALVMREELELLDDFESAMESSEDSATPVSEEDMKIPTGNKHITVGSASKPITFEDLEAQYSTDSAFKNFQAKLGTALTTHLDTRIRFSKTDTITPYKLVKVNYASTISWRQETNILRVNPHFHGHPRHDNVLVDIDGTQNNCIFAQLLQIFGVTVGERVYYMALILPMDAHDPTNPDYSKLNQEIDQALRLTRIRSRPRSKAVFINIESIVRGGLLARSYEDNIQMDEHLIIDVIDEDMWWRLKSINLIQNAPI